MKKAFTKFIVLSAMLLLAVSSAFAQGKGGSDYAQKETSPRGDEWEVIVFGDKKYDYFKGSDLIDGFRSNSRARLGFHWKGHRVSEVESDTLYLCNVATGEYLQIGDYWGETGMVNHVGLAYGLQKQTSRPSRSGAAWPDFVTTGYYIAPLDVREDRVIGRMNVNDGLFGHFEYNKYLALRHKDEYHDDWNDPVHPGGFFFEFHEVAGEKGEVEYIIYTHRRTNRNLNNFGDMIRAEYFNRDSYLLLTNAGKMNADFNSVRFLKFAGQMHPEDMTSKNVIIGDRTNTVDPSAVSTTNAHKYGTYSNAAGGNTFTTNATSGMANVKVTADGNYIKAAYYSDSKYQHTMIFHPTDANEHKVTISVPAGYAITSYSIQAIAGTNERKYTVTPKNGSSTNVDAALYTISKSGLYTQSDTILIKAANALEGEYGVLCFPVFNVTVEPMLMGDEKKYKNGAATISLSDGLTEAAKDKNNRWKLVTKKERDRFGLVASETQPVDMTSKIYNPKFYTSFNYNWAVSQCTKVDDTHYTHPNEDTDFGWQWFDRDAYPHPSNHHHVHPYNMDYSNHWTTKPEHHKVGTGHFWRTGHEGAPVDEQEFMMTQGQEANYCGSIFKGSANIQQRITGLREGLYVVYVRGFYAPHDMTKYTIDNWNDLSASNGDKMGENNTNKKAPDTWFNQARVKIGEEWMWRRSHDSYLFAWSYPKGKKGLNDQNDEIDLPAQEVRRMLPSIYEGAIRHNQLGRISKYNFLNMKKADGSVDSTFIYTQLGLWYLTGKKTNGETPDMESVNKQMELVRDENVFARYKGTFFDTGADAAYNWVVPKSVTGAARIFNAVDAMDESDPTSTGDTHHNADNYRIGLPVYVGPDGELVIGVDHSKVDGSFDSEWVCFDDFELLYLGKVEPNEFVIDEIDGSKDVGPFEMINGNDGSVIMEGGNPKMSAKTKMKNNTQWIDLFNPSNIATDPNFTTVKTVVLRRTMPKDGWSYVVLPVSLTLKHVKEMFGEKANVSKLDRFEGRTIYYKNQLTGKADNQIVMQAGVPYIVRPSKYPEISAGSEFKYNRPSFSKAYSATANGVAGWFLEDETRNYQVERSMEGPIWIATDVEIKSRESFPDMRYEGGQAVGDGSIWTEITPFTSSQAFVIEGKPEQGTYKMVETGVYEPGEYIPANSYYYAGGKMYFTTGRVGPCPRGLYAFMQMIRQEDNTAYAKPFVGGDDNFIEVVNQPTGITDINQPLPDGKMEIYDLQGRKVTNPGRGIYIVNGVKTVFN